MPHLGELGLFLNVITIVALPELSTSPFSRDTLGSGLLFCASLLPLLAPTDAQLSITRGWLDLCDDN